MARGRTLVVGSGPTRRSGARRVLRGRFGRPLRHRSPAGPLAQLHFVIRLPRDREVPTVDEARLQERLSAVTRTWVEGLTEAVASQVQDEAAVGDLVAHYADAFPEAYKEDFSPTTAALDVGRLEAIVGDPGIDLSLFSPLDAGRGDRGVHL